MAKKKPTRKWAFFIVCMSLLAVGSGNWDDEGIADFDVVNVADVVDAG